jgi:formylglycine-generating enzyme required for sulfatase activity
VDDVLERALKKDPQERFETCGAFIADLEVAIRGAADAAVQPSPAPPDETVVLPSPGEPGPRASGVAPECGAVKTNAADGQKYVWIPPGTFLMGAPAGAESDEDERPSREVTITKGFWMGQTPVTLGAYRKYAQTTGRSMPPDEDFLGRKANAALGDDRLPVVLVSWDDACAYAAWAGLKLPTEAQWEYAARGGSAAATYGNLEDIAWYSGNSTGPRPVALKRANAFGLFDALGNVWEWTADWYGEDFYQIAEPQDPGGPAEGVFRVVRGGAWFNDARMVRVCKRYTRKPGGRYNTVGFRCLTV